MLLRKSLPRASSWVVRRVTPVSGRLAGAKGPGRRWCSSEEEDAERVSRFDFPDSMDAYPAEARVARDKLGFVPNIFKGLSRRPAEMAAFMAYHNALMEPGPDGEFSSELTRAEREMIVVATSAVNDCLYCIVAHGALLRLFSKNPRLADQLAVNYRQCKDISDKQRLMLDFAVKLAMEPGESTRTRTHPLWGAADWFACAGRVEDDDVARLREAGFSEDAIWDIGSITAFFGMSNRLVHAVGIPPNHGFYDLGRTPRGSKPQSS